MRMIVKSEDGTKYARYSTTVMGYTHPFMALDKLQEALKDESWEDAYSGFHNAKTYKDLMKEGLV